MALGAFLAGMVVGQSDFSLRAASEALPMRDAFAVLFFVSVGMLFDPMIVLRDPLPVLAAVVIIVIVSVVIFGALAFVRISRRRPVDGVASFRRHIDALSPESRRAVMDRVRPSYEPNADVDSQETTD